MDMACGIVVGIGDGRNVIVQHIRDDENYKRDQEFVSARPASPRFTAASPRSHASTFSRDLARVVSARLGLGQDTGRGS